MKTKLLLAGAFLSVFMVSKAQTLYSNDFTAGTGLTVIDGDGDTFNWGLYTGNATTAGWGLTGNFAGSRSWNPAVPGGSPATALTPNNFLISPEVVIPDNFSTTTLSFKLGSNDTQFFAEQISIYLAPATANTPALIAALTPVFNYTLTVDNVQTAETISIDVSEHAGETVRIIMRHHDCTDQDLMYFDDLLLSQEALATESFSASQFSVFPNPANDIVNVVNTLNNKLTSVTLTDMNGRTVKEVAVDNLSKIQLNISDLNSGLYLMNIKSDKGEINKKIMKN